MQTLAFEEFGKRACALQPEWYRYISDVQAHDVARDTAWPFVFRAICGQFPWEVAMPIIEDVKYPGQGPKKARSAMPFGEYEDFDDCVRKNQHKDDPEAYCASIKQRIEGSQAAEQIVHAEDNLAQGRRRPVDISGGDYDGD